MEKKLLDMKNISKSFGSVQALKGVSWTSMQAKFWLLWVRMVQVNQL